MVKSLFLWTMVIALASCKPSRTSSTKHDDTTVGADATTPYKVEARMTDDLTGFSIVGIDLDNIALSSILPDGKFVQGQAAVSVTMPRFKITFTAVNKTAKTPLSCELFLPLTFVKTDPMPVVDSAACKGAS